MWQNALIGMGAAVLGEGIQQGAKALYSGSFVEDTYKSFKSTSTGQWFDKIFSSEGVQGTLKSVTGDLVQQGLGIAPRDAIGNASLNSVRTGTDTFRSRNQMGQAGGPTATFALGSGNAVRTALLDTNVQAKLAGWVQSSGKVKQQFVTPNVPFAGKATLKSGVIKRAD